jgi:hypothetical protein
VPQVARDLRPPSSLDGERRGHTVPELRGGRRRLKHRPGRLRGGGRTAQRGSGVRAGPHLLGDPVERVGERGRGGVRGAVASGAHPAAPPRHGRAPTDHCSRRSERQQPGKRTRGHRDRHRYRPVAGQPVGSTVQRREPKWCRAAG